MAKQPDHGKPQRKPEHDKDAAVPGADHVIDANLDEPGNQQGPKTKGHPERGPAQPTRIAPYQSPDLDVGEPDHLAATPHVSADHTTPMGQKSPHVEPVDGNDAGIWEDEAGLAPKTSDGSSIVEAAEVVEEMDEEPSDVQSVFAQDAGQGPRSSSIIEAAELAEVVDVSDDVLADEEINEGSSVASASVILADSGVTPEVAAETSNAGSASPGSGASASDVVLSADEVMVDAAPGPAEDFAEIKPAPATPPPLMDDDVVVSEFLDVQGQATSSGSRGRVDASGEGLLAKPTKPAPVEDDVVDLGSDPDMDAAASRQRMEEAMVESGLEDHVTEEIDWDDIGEIGDSKTAKKPVDDDQTIAFEKESASAAKRRPASPSQGDTFEGELPPAARKTAPPEEDEVSFDDVNAEDIAEGAEAKELAASGLLDNKEAAFALRSDEPEAPASEKREELPVANKRKGKKKSDEDSELVGAGAGKLLATPAAKPKYGRSMAGGMVLATVLLGGIAAGLWYAKPDLLEKAYQASPNYVAPKKEKARIDPPVVRARALMDNKDFDQALGLLKNADDTPANLTARAEARWHKYLQENTAAEKPLDKNAAEVKDVLADLDKAGNKLLALQVTKTLGESELREELKSRESKLIELTARAEKAEAAKKETEKLLADNNAGLATVNKLLEGAKIKDSGDKGVANLITAKKEAEDKLDGVSKLLAGEKLSGDAKGVAELISSRDKVAKDRDELDDLVKGAYKELAEGGLAPPGEEARAKIVDAVKSARQKAEAPLAIALNQLVASLAGLGTGANKVVEKSYDVTAAASDAGLSRLSKLLAQLPALEKPEPPPADPALADQFYAKGLNLFFSRRYAEAETEFKQAIQNYSQDARYQYFLGLALASQPDSLKRNAAAEALQLGARLEAANHPSLGEINASLERIQGAQRSFVNSFRQRSRAAAN
jgi:hypothetical protein